MGMDMVIDANTQKAMDRYEKALVQAGYSEGSVETYIKSVMRFLRRGGRSDADGAKEYFENFGIKSHAAKAGVTKWVQFLADGKPIKRTYQARPIRQVVYDCDRDCFNCKYEDCLLPSSMY